MSKKLQDTIYDFLQLVSKNVNNGLSYTDAIDLSAVTIGNVIPSIISKATSKYQEAIHYDTELSQQDNVDVLAFLSMDELWHENTYNKDLDISLDLEDILAQSIYLILKYNETNNILEANCLLLGAQEARESMIQIIIGF